MQKCTAGLARASLARSLVLIIMAAQLVLTQARYYEDDEEEDEKDRPGFGGKLVKSLIFAAISTVVGFLVMFPFEFVRHSEEYQEKLAETESSATAFMQTFAVVMPECTSPGAVEFALESFYLFAPRLMLKLLAYGVIRGFGPTNPVLVLLASIAGGLATMLYVYPLRKAEAEEADTGRFEDFAEYVRNKISEEGISALYEGVTNDLPIMVIFHVLFFGTMEACSSILQHNVALDLFIAAPLAVTVSSLFGAPLEHLRQVIAENPFDYGAFFLDDERALRWPLEWGELGEYLSNTYATWSEEGVVSQLGSVSFSVNTAALGMALFVDHALLAA